MVDHNFQKHTELDNNFIIQDLSSKSISASIQCETYKTSAECMLQVAPDLQYNYDMPTSYSERNQYNQHLQNFENFYGNNYSYDYYNNQEIQPTYQQNLHSPTSYLNQTLIPPVDKYNISKIGEDVKISETSEDFHLK